MSRPSPVLRFYGRAMAEDDQPSELAVTSVRMLAEGLAAAVSSVNPAAGITAAMLVAAVDPAIARLGQFVQRTRAEQANNVLTVASTESGLTREELVDRLSGDPARLIVTADIVQAAMSTTLQEKLVLLGESLARLTRDDARVDRERQGVFKVGDGQ